MNCDLACDSSVRMVTVPGCPFFLLCHASTHMHGPHAAAITDPQALSSFSSLSLEEVAAIRGPEQPMWFQLYVNPNRTKTAEMIKRADKYEELNAHLRETAC